MSSHRAARRSTTLSAMRFRQTWVKRPTVAEELSDPEVLSAAIRNDQLRIFYHPIVDLAGNSVLGHEVLVRWQHPELGLLSPAEFLPAIDADPALSRQLGRWVLEQSCAGSMQSGGQLLLSVNVSAHHLTEPGFAGHVTQVLRVTGFPPSRLILELTEASLQSPTAEAVATCMDLAELGVAFALDDVGSTGSLTGVDALPISIIKIDRHIVAGIGSDPTAEVFIGQVLELARAAGRRTIAVGVETHDQARFLREREVTYAQGYLFGRPKPR